MYLSAITLFAFGLSTLTSAAPLPISQDITIPGTSTPVAKVDVDPTPVVEALASIVKDLKEKLIPVVQKVEGVPGLAIDTVTPIKDEVITILQAAVADVSKLVPIVVSKAEGTVADVEETVKDDVLPELIKDVGEILRIIVGVLGKTLLTVEAIKDDVPKLLADIGVVASLLIKTILTTLGPLATDLVSGLVPIVGDLADIVGVFGIQDILKH